MISQGNRSTFVFGRELPFPSLYEENKSAVTEDILQVGWIATFWVLYFCFLFILPAVSGKLEKLFYFLRVTMFLVLGLLIALCMFGQEWEVGEVHSKMFYKSGSHQEIHGEVKVKMGLHAINITLKNISELAEDFFEEKINYNERFFWFNGKGQGRGGFGPFASEVNQQLRVAQMRGTPYPILWVAETLTYDGEGLRYGRNYRLAGFYAGFCLWACFPTWFLTMVLFKMVIRYGAMMLSLLGSLLLLSGTIWACRRNFTELVVLFSDGKLQTRYGSNWYLAIVFGPTFIIIGIVIYFLDSQYHNGLCRFFGIDPYNVIDEEYEFGNEECISLSPKSGSKEFELEEPGLRRKFRATVSFRIRGQRSKSRKMPLLSESSATVINAYLKKESEYQTKGEFEELRSSEVDEMSQMAAEAFQMPLDDALLIDNSTEDSSQFAMERQILED